MRLRNADHPESKRLDEASSMLESRFVLPKQAKAVFAALVLLCFGCHSNALQGYNVDDPNLTPLMNAARQNDLPRVRTLLAQGADVKASAKYGETALYVAIKRIDLNADNLPIVDALLEAGADPNEVEYSTLNPLRVSLGQGRDYPNPAVTLRLLQAGAHVPHECPPQNSEDSLLSLATQESSPEVMRALIERGSPVNCQYYGESALYWALAYRQFDRVALLRKSGADLRQPLTQWLTDVAYKLEGSLLIGSLGYAATLVVLGFITAFVKRVPFRVMLKASMLVGSGFTLSQRSSVIGFPFRLHSHPRWIQESPGTELKEMINNSLALGVLALAVGMAVRLVRGNVYRADEPKAFWWIVATLFVIGFYLSMTI